MTKIRALNLLVFRAGPTVWDAQGLVSGSADMPLIPEALHLAKATFACLNGTASKVAAVCCGPEEACVKAADLFAAYCGVQELVDKGLQEVSLGLWEGLREGEISHRYTSLHRQWRQDPFSVVVPESEGFEKAARRVVQTLLKLMPKRAAMLKRSLLQAHIPRGLGTGLVGGLAAGESPLIGVVVRPWIFGMLVAGWMPGCVDANGRDPSMVRDWAMGSERMRQVRLVLDTQGSGKQNNAQRLSSGPEDAHAQRTLEAT